MPRSIALFVTALFNFGIGIFWVIIGGSEFLPGSDVRPVTAYWIMVAGMLFLAAGVGLLARMPTARGFVFFVHPLWVIYMIVGMFRSEVELWLGILAILLHGVTWIPACFCSQDFVHGDGEVANPLGQVTVFLFALFLIVVVGIGLWISIASGPSLPQQKY